MRRNPSIEFVIMQRQRLFRRLLNIKVVPITVAEFKATVKAKLDIDHPMQETSEEWARKLPDFKPVVAHLFRESQTQVLGLLRLGFD
jgi:hypothetical protein